MQAKDIMKKDVIFVREDDKVYHIIEVLTKNNVSGVPVVNINQEIVGILTEKDLITRREGLNIPSCIAFMQRILFVDGGLEYQKRREQIMKLAAKDMMSTQIYTVGLEASVQEIVSLMINRRINRIPVVDENHKLTGIIGRSDLLPLLITNKEGVCTRHKGF